MTLSYSLTWLIHVMCVKSSSHVWHDLLYVERRLFVMWLIHMCDVTHPHVWRELRDVTHVNRSISSDDFFVSCLIYRCDMAYSERENDTLVQDLPFWEGERESSHARARMRMCARASMGERENARERESKRERKSRRLHLFKREGMI